MASILEVLQPSIAGALEHANRALGESLLREVARLEAKIDRIKKVEKPAMEEDESKKRKQGAAGYEIDEGVAATSAWMEAASPESTRPSRTCKRRFRRKRCETNHRLSRELLLQHRHTLPSRDTAEKGTALQQIENRELVVASVDRVTVEPSAPPGLNSVLSASQFQVGLEERVAELEVALRYMSSSFVEWGPWQAAIPADVLGRECAAVKVLQRMWRRYCVVQRESFFRGLLETIQSQSFPYELACQLQGVDNATLKSGTLGLPERQYKKTSTETAECETVIRFRALEERVGKVSMVQGEVSALGTHVALLENKMRELDEAVTVIETTLKMSGLLNEL
jgi:hypothetical protein